MKIGFRKPSLKKSIKARTTGKIKRKMKKAVNPLYGKKGMGYLKDPERAVKNKIYKKTTFGVPDVVRYATPDTSSKKNINTNKKESATEKDNKIMENENITISKKSKKIILGIAIVLILLIVYGISSAFSGNNVEFEFATDPSKTVELKADGYDWEQIKHSYFKFKAKKDITLDDVEFISDNPDIATFTYDETISDDLVYYNITAVSAGETYVYVQLKDKSVISDKIKVVVSGTGSTTQVERINKYFETDNVINDFFVDFNKISKHKIEFEEISKGNIDTKALVYSDNFSLEIVNSKRNDLYISIWTSPSNENSTMYDLFEDCIKTMNDDLKTEEIRKAWDAIHETGYMVEDYEFNGIYVTYIPYKELSNNNHSNLRIDLKFSIE